MHSQRGASTVETAVAMSLMLLLVFGIFYCSQLLYTFQLVGNAARLGTRYAMVRGSGCTSPCSSATASSVQSYVRAQSVGLTASSMTVTTTWSPAASPTSACNAGTGSNAPGHVVCVTVSYPFSYPLPLVPSAAITVSSTSQMMISQ